jgi:hypothetical protein
MKYRGSTSHRERIMNEGSTSHRERYRTDSVSGAGMKTSVSPRS